MEKTGAADAIRELTKAAEAPEEDSPAPVAPPVGTQQQWSPGTNYKMSYKFAGATMAAGKGKRSLRDIESETVSLYGVSPTPATIRKLKGESPIKRGRKAPMAEAGVGAQKPA